MSDTKPEAASTSAPAPGTEASALAAPKAIIKNVDMSEDMQQAVVDIATEALAKFSVEKDIAAHVKRTLDTKFGATWHAVVGKNFGSYVTHGMLCPLPLPLPLALFSLLTHGLTKQRQGTLSTFVSTSQPPQPPTLGIGAELTVCPNRPRPDCLSPLESVIRLTLSQSQQASNHSCRACVQVFLLSLSRCATRPSWHAPTRASCAGRVAGPGRYPGPGLGLGFGLSCPGDAAACASPQSHAGPA